MCVTWVVFMNEMRQSAVLNDQYVVSITQILVLLFFLAPLRYSILNMPITEHPKDRFEWCLDPWHNETLCGGAGGGLQLIFNKSYILSCFVFHPHSANQIKKIK